MADPVSGAAITAAVGSGAGSIFSGFLGNEGEKARQQALEQQKHEIEMQTISQQTQLMEKTNKTMAAQLTQAASSGYDLSSTSFNAVSKDTLDMYEQDRNGLELSKYYKEQSLDAGIAASKAAGTADIVGGITSAAKEGIDLYGGSLFGGSSGGSASSLFAEVPNTDISYKQFEDSQDMFKMPSLFNTGDI